MKSKSSSINYDAIYHFLFTIVITFFIYVFTSFFLLFSPAICVALLFISVISLIFNFVFHRAYWLYISFGACLLCIVATFLLSTAA
ncbi:MAG: hypothetical protein ATN36_01940 [Epulopiscium sp. Nele67-Bin005]|nr:MAG: hypothetical protein ATN36_01940 [Epulopiscium sp. Nele67-Bin005]